MAEFAVEIMIAVLAAHEIRAPFTASEIVSGVFRVNDIVPAEGPDLAWVVGAVKSFARAAPG